MLGHQLPALPALEDLWRELPALFDWLEGRAAEKGLRAVGAGQDVDPGWSAPAGIAVWNVPFALEAIRFAAANRLCVELVYKGETRVVEPYSIRRTQGGALLLFVVRSDNGELRSYRLDGIRSARATQRTFVPRFQVELNATGALRAPNTSRASGRGRRPGRGSSTARYRVECPMCGRTFTRIRPRSDLRRHQQRDGSPCHARRGILRLA
jgi:hypothetical protein